MRMKLMIFVMLGCVAVSAQALASGNVAKAPDKICPILVGSDLPPITLQDIEGKSFDLNKAVTAKPTVLIYFRGGW